MAAAFVASPTDSLLNEQPLEEPDCNDVRSGFSSRTFSNAEAPVRGTEVVEGVYEFDFPFLADKRVLEATIATFREEHPELKITYIYTGPSELNSKKKTHLLLYIFAD